jgi:preprotein translocase subunit SecB
MLANRHDQAAGAAATDKQAPTKEASTMADNEAKNEGNGSAQKTGNGNDKTAQPAALSILTQYVKDLSFESPGAPQSLRGRDKAPGISINVNVNANPISETEFDVLLTLTAQASFEKDKDVLFNIELVYGGVFRIEGFPQEHMLPILFIECPRLLFPFARQIIAECSRNGGFPPLMIDPVDFAQMFQQRMAEEQARQKVQATS